MREYKKGEKGERRGGRRKERRGGGGGWPRKGPTDQNQRQSNGAKNLRLEKSKD